MVKQKRNIVSKGDWKDLRVSDNTAKRLMLFKINSNLLTYDQAINILLNKAGEPQ